MIDLRTTYLGLELRTPLVASAGPVTGDPAMWSRLERSGAGAIVLPSLFEEQIEVDAFAVDALLDAGNDVFAEALNYLPDLEYYDTGPDRQLALAERAVEALEIPVIASLNGTSSGGWVHYARHLASTGVAALELNIFDVVVDREQSGADVEKRYLDLVADVKAEIDIPVAVKLGPWFTSPAHFAEALVAAGADGLVLFNRFYQPQINLQTLEVRPQLQLSTTSEVRLPLHWIAILSGQVDCSLAASTGVHGGDDVVRLLLAGADAVCTTSALLLHGPEHLKTLLAGVRAWMEEHGYVSVDQLRGSMRLDHVSEPQSYQRANYFQVLHSWSSTVER
jgi:dihydroorotate dehydrogenase (fumarate)